MWISKPVKLLTPTEELAWSTCLERSARASGEAPMAQTLAWARAIDAVHGAAFLVFSPEERAGGIVFKTGAGADFECVNGPLLDWDDADRAPRQLATFALGVSKLDSGFSSLALSPRWSPEDLSSRLGCLPIPPAGVKKAATLVVDLRGSDEEQLRSFAPRFRRSLVLAGRLASHASIDSVSLESLAEFVPRLRNFAQKRGFFAPDLAWFQELARSASPSGPGPRFWQVSTRVEEGGSSAESHLFLAAHRDTAHYLFGFEERSGPARAALSPASLAHWTAMRHLRAGGCRFYDLNGYVADVPPGHPYAGVCRFKEQFGGRVVSYVSPEFRIV